MQLPLLNEILTNWGVDFRKIRFDLPLSGSPERSLRRFVIEDKDGNMFVLEEIGQRQASRRKETASVLQQLRAGGLNNIQTYLPTRSGDYLLSQPSRIYQLSPYVQGTSLNRPGYIFDGWRGKAMADFLVDLKKAASRDLRLTSNKPFSILQFITDLQRAMQLQNPDTLRQTQPIVNFLNDDFNDVHDSVPVMFCHGDFHPLNVIWSPDGIETVIDWEFSGSKPEFYDAANLIGCIGMENPEGLTGPLIANFIEVLDDSRYLSPPSRNYLAEAVLALRFAWLSVWLRNQDHEMIDLEVFYLKLLMKNMPALKSAWKGNN